MVPGAPHEPDTTGPVIGTDADPLVNDYELPLHVHLEIEPGETIVFAIRQSPLMPLAQLWPVAVGFFGWAFLNALAESVAGQSVPMVIQFAILAVTTILAFRWLIRDGLGWFVCWYVLTTRRIIVARGVLRRMRYEASVARIQTINFERSNPIANALRIGDVQVLTASSTGFIWLRGVSKPEDVTYTITLVKQGKYGKRDDDAASAGQSPVDTSVVHAAVGTLLAEEDDEVEEDTEHLQLLSGSLLRRPIDLAMLPGERVLDRLYRHWFTLFLRLLPPFGIGVAVIFVLAVVRTLIGGNLVGIFVLMMIAGLATLIWEMLIVTNYVDDVFILTTQRIIDVEREYFIFAEAQRETMFRNVQDVDIDIPLLGRYFDYGHIHVETAGRAPNIDMRNMSSPRRTQERIFALINSDKLEREANERKQQHKDLQSSLETVLNALMLATPDVRGLPVAAAVSRLRAVGLSVAIMGERPSSQVAPGIVLAQMPGPGATALRGAEVAITLSRRPTFARP